MLKKLILTVCFIFLANPLAAYVLPLDEISDIITDPNDLIVLKEWESRLDTYRKGLQTIAEIRIKECHGVSSQLFQERNCPSKLRTLEKQQTLYTEDATIFNLAVAMATEWAEYPNRRLTNSEKGEKVDLILKALFHGNGDWGESLAYMNNYVANNPGNRAAQEALKYLESLTARIIRGKIPG